jgi:hypothetical protein
MVSRSSFRRKPLQQTGASAGFEYAQYWTVDGLDRRPRRAQRPARRRMRAGLHFTAYGDAFERSELSLSAWRETD